MLCDAQSFYAGEQNCDSEILPVGKLLTDLAFRTNDLKNELLVNQFYFNFSHLSVNPVTDLPELPAAFGQGVCPRAWTGAVRRVSS